MIEFKEDAKKMLKMLFHPEIKKELAELMEEREYIYKYILDCLVRGSLTQIHEQPYNDSRTKFQLPWLISRNLPHDPDVFDLKFRDGTYVCSFRLYRSVPEKYFSGYDVDNDVYWIYTHTSLEYDKIINEDLYDSVEIKERIKEWKRKLSLSLERAMRLIELTAKP